VLFAPPVDVENDFLTTALAGQTSLSTQWKYIMFPFRFLQLDRFYKLEKKHNKKVSFDIKVLQKWFKFLVLQGKFFNCSNPKFG